MLWLVVLSGCGSNMNREKLVIAIVEAKRFIAKAQAAADEFDRNEYAWNGTKETGAARRSSMDLTRALAELRRPS